MSASVEVVVSFDDHMAFSNQVYQAYPIRIAFIPDEYHLVDRETSGLPQ